MNDARLWHAWLRINRILAANAIKVRVQRVDRPEVTKLYSLGGGFRSLLRSYSGRAPGPISNHNS
jgi:hypothetical protein